MTKSMTGFGRADVSSNLGKLSLEISTVNKRFLEINMYLPKSLSFLENDIKKKVEKSLFRGQILLKFEFFSGEKNVISFLPNISHLKSLKKSWEKLSMNLGYSKDDITLDFILEKAKYFPEEKIKDVEALKKLIFDSLTKALNGVVEMRIREGKAIVLDIEKRLNKIKKELTYIRKKAPSAKKRYEQKLKDKFLTLFKEMQEIEDRLLKEAAIFADKVDIAEEMTRLDSHLKQFLVFLKGKKEAIGRKLDFLLQECLRETNTIASKASDADISRSCVEIKDELEKIKEQLQNIE